MNWKLKNNISCELLDEVKYNNLKSAKKDCNNNLECYGILTKCYDYTKDDLVYCNDDDRENEFKGSLEACKSFCNANDDCEGISYENGMCALRETKCKSTIDLLLNTDSNYYKKEKSPSNIYQLCKSNFTNNTNNCIYKKNNNYKYQELSRLYHNENEFNISKKHFWKKQILIYSIFLFVIILILWLDEYILLILTKIVDIFKV